MDTSNTQSRRRDIVYCHQCENEWYRDEHGLACPECHSDFTEIVEPDNDPREDEQHIPRDTTPHAHGDFNAPDPDEGDIDNLRWEETGPGRYRVRGTYRQDYPMGAQPPQQQGQGQGQGQGGLAGGLMGLVGNMLQGALGGQQQGGQQRQQGPPTPGRPASAPGSPAPDGQRGPGTFVRHGHGPGFSYTIASTSGGNLFPRNANGPQPYQQQPDNMERMLQQMIANIGVMPGGPMAGGMRGGPGGPHFHDHDHDHGMYPGFGPPPFAMGGGGPGGMGPFGNLFQMFGPPGVAGDAVYTQEALDRIMTQLMEQHQTGNAPGPATEAAISSLPKKVITKQDQGESGKAECSICMDEVELGGTVTVLPCTHWFHHECIKAWLSEHDTCPHCRQGIMPKEGDASNSNQPRAPSEAPLHDMRSPEYARPAVPGAYPFPGQNPRDGDGSAQNPFQVPNSPTMGRRNSTGRTNSNSAGAGGVFSRMRDAFGNRGSSSGGGDDYGSGGRG
ncbi:hypothetical protein LTR37_009546 [Vermiconidia calcicola]|uniref:Uncharacterized protein n=1 Tax=Vermiconidia calcicola TaxID=1690605 RepID=A0ACC3N7T8_9PEZI|nr:hypothetical protein LTR37_009546 [Vermiconidia calcicola]